MANWLGEFFDRAKQVLDDAAEKSGKERGEGFWVTDIKDSGPLPHIDEEKEAEAKKKK